MRTLPLFPDPTKHIDNRSHPSTKDRLKKWRSSRTITQKAPREEGLFVIVTLNQAGINR
jgi:hypothetical protein